MWIALCCVGKEPAPGCQGSRDFVWEGRHSHRMLSSQCACSKANAETRCNPHLRVFLPPCLIRVQYPPNEYSRSCLLCVCMSACACGWERMESVGNYVAFPGESLFVLLSVYPHTFLAVKSQQPITDPLLKLILLKFVGIFPFTLTFPNNTLLNPHSHAAYCAVCCTSRSFCKNKHWEKRFFSCHPICQPVGRDQSHHLSDLKLNVAEVIKEHSFSSPLL